MAQTPEEIRERNKIKAREKRKRLKELGIKDTKASDRVKKFQENKDKISFFTEKETADHIKKVCKDKNLSYLEFFKVYSSKKLVIQVTDYVEFFVSFDKPVFAPIKNKIWGTGEGYFNVVVLYLREDLTLDDIKLLDFLKNKFIVDYLIK